MYFIQLCNCSTYGSLKQQCDLTTGICKCLQGYTGTSCDRCDHGYYGYPKCRRCSCNLAGIDRVKGRCDKNHLCQCHNDGSCPCKVFIMLLILN